MKNKIITIDGLSSCGKSTLARQLANKLGFIYIDSGAMYRAITVYFLRNNIALEEDEQIKEAMANISIDFRVNEQTGMTEVYLNDENIHYIIRDIVVAEKVSEIAAIKEVREFAVKEQQKLGEKGGLVMDGRDIGTTVFPHALVKFFMKADEAIRVERRFTELYAKNPNITVEEVKNNIALRDYIDSNREISPLRQAPDAIVIDNTHLSEQEQLDLAFKTVKEKLEAA